MITILLALIAAAVVWIALSKARESGRREAAAAVPDQRAIAGTALSPRTTSPSPSASSDAADFETVEREMSAADALVEKGKAALNRSDVKEAIECFVEAMNASWRAVQHIVLAWRAAWESPSYDADMRRSVVTVTLEDLAEKRGAQRSPLVALITITQQAHDICAMLAQREPVKLVLPSAADRDALIEAERAVRNGARAIGHQKAAVDAAFQDLGTAWARYVDTQDSITKAEDLLELLADVVRAAKDTFVTVHVALPILLWPLEPAR